MSFERSESCINETTVASVLSSLIKEQAGTSEPHASDIFHVIHNILAASEDLRQLPATQQVLTRLTQEMGHTPHRRHRSVPTKRRHGVHTPTRRPSKDNSSFQHKASSWALDESASEDVRSRSRFQTQPMNYRLCDGLDTPASIWVALEHFYGEDYKPDCTMREFLSSLVPGKMGESHLTKLLEDFAEFNRRRTFGKVRLSEDERLALFTYTYEIKVSVQEILPNLSEGELAQQINNLLHKKHVEPLSDGALEGLSGTDVMAYFTMGWPLENVSEEDAEKLRSFYKWSSLPENYVSYSYQLYKDMNDAMRSFSTRDPGHLKLYLPFIYYATTALKRLPNPIDNNEKRPYLVVFRGIDVNIQDGVYGPGSTICWPAFSSTSRSSEVAKSFLAGQATGALFIIETANGRDVSKLSHFPEEKEHLLLPQSLFRVKGMASSGMRQILSLPDSVQIIELRELAEEESKVEFLVAEASRAYKHYQKEKALRLYDEAYRKYPNTSMGLFCRGMAFAWDKKGFLCPEGMEQSEYQKWRLSESLEYFTKALEQEPNHPMVLTHYAYVLKMKEDIPSARYFFWRALQVDPSLGDAIHGLAEIQLMTKDFEGVQQMGRMSAAAHLNASKAMWAHGKKDEGMKTAFKSYLADPCNAATCEWLKEIFVQREMQTELDLLEQACRDHDADPLGKDVFYEYLAPQFAVDRNPFCLGRQSQRASTVNANCDNP